MTAMPPKSHMLATRGCAPTPAPSQYAASNRVLPVCWRVAFKSDAFESITDDIDSMCAIMSVVPLIAQSAPKCTVAFPPIDLRESAATRHSSKSIYTAGQVLSTVDVQISAALTAKDQLFRHPLIDLQVSKQGLFERDSAY